jgi:hypothetical protein
MLHKELKLEKDLMNISVYFGLNTEIGVDGVGNISEAKRWKSMKMLNLLLKIIFYPVSQIFWFTIFLLWAVAKLFNYDINIQIGKKGTANASVWFDTFINKWVLVDREFVQDYMEVFTKKTPIGSALSGFDIPFEIIKKTDLRNSGLKVHIVSKTKQRALQFLKDNIDKSATNLSSSGVHSKEQNIIIPKISDLLLETDKKFQMTLCSSIVEKGIVPNFIRSDLRVWETITKGLREEELEKYDEALTAASSVSEAEVNSSTPRDTPYPSSAVNKFWVDEDRNLILYSEFSDFKTKLNLQLWRYNKVDIDKSVAAAEQLGNWVNLLCPEARKFLYLSVTASEKMNKHGSQSDIDFFIRSAFYGLIQAADIEFTTRVSVPFQQSLSSINDKDMVGNYDEFKLFITGNYPPSLGGIGKFLDFVRKGKNPDKVSTAFLEFVEQSEYLNIEDLTNKKFVQKLYQLGRLRGSIMHPDKINLHDSKSVLNYLLNYNYPGEFFFKIGIDKGF